MVLAHTTSLRILFLFFPSPFALQVTGLYRYAVKGLSGDALESVTLGRGQTFPDDRRFALLHANREWKAGQWLHKENFLCAFTAPEFLAQFESSYRIVSAEDLISRGFPCDAPVSVDETQRLLTVRERSSGKLLLHLNLAVERDRRKLAAFLSEKSSQHVVCITSSSPTQDFQFGNTSSGYKQRGDTRTIHLINHATVNEFASKVGHRLNPTRFRPNLVVGGGGAWSEFDWMGRTLREPESGLELTVLAKTVRCKGVSVDPLDPTVVLDVPALLVEHFPELGPYLGVYAVVDVPGRLELGSRLELVD